MFNYFATFPTGFESKVRILLEKEFRARIFHLENGFLDFSLSRKLNKEIPFLSNIFALLDKGSFQEKMTPEYVISTLRIPQLTSLVGRHRGTFRVMISFKGSTVSIKPRYLNDLESRIRSLSKLQIDRIRPDNEFWLFMRSSKKWYFGIRQTNRSSDKYDKGEIKTEIGSLIYSYSEPDKNDIILDPFVGGGSLLIQRLEQYPYTKVIIGDKDINTLKKASRKLGDLKNISIKKMDATNMSEIKSHSISKIITDPPWGNFHKADLEELYEKMLNEFARVIKDDGIIVIITSAKDVFLSCLKQNKYLKVIEQVDILISGKKVGLYKLSRNL